MIGLTVRSTPARSTLNEGPDPEASRHIDLSRRMLDPDCAYITLGHLRKAVRHRAFQGAGRGDARRAGYGMRGMKRMRR